MQRGCKALLKQRQRPYFEDQAGAISPLLEHFAKIEAGTSVPERFSSVGICNAPESRIVCVSTSEDTSIRGYYFGPSKRRFRGRSANPLPDWFTAIFQAQI